MKSPRYPPMFATMSVNPNETNSCCLRRKLIWYKLPLHLLRQIYLPQARGCCSHGGERKDDGTPLPPPRPCWRLNWSCSWQSWNSLIIGSVGAGRSMDLGDVWNKLWIMLIFFFAEIWVLVFTNEYPTTLSKFNIDVIQAWKFSTLVKPTTRMRIDPPWFPCGILFRRNLDMSTFFQNFFFRELTQSLKFLEDLQELWKQGSRPSHRGETCTWCCQRYLWASHPSSAFWPPLHCEPLQRLLTSSHCKILPLDCCPYYFHRQIDQKRPSCLECLCSNIWICHEWHIRPTQNTFHFILNAKSNMLEITIMTKYFHIYSQIDYRLLPG